MNQPASSVFPEGQCDLAALYTKRQSWVLSPAGLTSSAVAGVAGSQTFLSPARSRRCSTSPYLLMCKMGKE